MIELTLDEVVKLANAAQRAPMIPPEGVEIMAIVQKIQDIINKEDDVSDQ